jgi:HPt (histidine-containing phosphotransfer) domain-containing protein
VILSASVTLEARERATKAGADEFISKPFDAAVLIQKVDELGERARRSARQPSIERPTVISPSAPNRPERSEASSGERADLVDMSRLAELEDIARDSSFMTELLRGFKTDVEGILQKLDVCLAAGDLTSVNDLMHTLKGAAVGVGARQLARRCAEMDRAVLDASSTALAQRADALRGCFNETVTYLADYVMRQHHVSL